jgi:hypothetical protein
VQPANFERSIWSGKWFQIGCFGGFAFAALVTYCTAEWKGTLIETLRASSGEALYNGVVCGMLGAGAVMLWRLLYGFLGPDSTESLSVDDKSTNVILHRERNAERKPEAPNEGIQTDESQSLDIQP